MSNHPPITYCANHPGVETVLRCNYCEKPICPKCVIRTPTGYRCKECVRGHQKSFDTALWYDYPLAAAIAFVLSYLGSQIAATIGFLTLFVAPIAGVIIAEIVRWVIRRRRSLRLPLVAAVAAALGGLAPLLQILLILILGGGLFNFGFSLLWQLLYIIAITSTIYYRLGGIQIQ